MGEIDAFLEEGAEMPCEKLPQFESLEPSMRPRF
jgi:hypothetical protein